MKNTNKKNEVGVIVGRFQVHRLTDGHCEVLEHVLSKNHSINILVLGNTTKDVRSTKNNPIPYVSRRSMIENAYPGKFIICYINDEQSNEAWSKKLDDLILCHTDGNTDVTLYGSRDSFLQHYTGGFDCEEYEQRLFFSGTSLRNEISKNIGLSEDFRKGCIYATQQSWSFYFPTVDCAIFTDTSYKKIYLAKKPNEDKYVFPGGFIDPKDENYESAALRECKEETNLDCSIMDYLGSFKIKDWRYRSEQESIMTILYSMITSNHNAIASDDIETLELVEIATIDINDIKEGHRPLFERVKEYSIQKYKEFLDNQNKMLKELSSNR